MATTWAKDYQPVVYEWFREGVEQIPSLIPMLYNVQPATGLYEYALGVGGVPVEQWSLYKETGETPHVDMDRGYATTFTHEDYKVRYALKKALIRQDKLGVVQEGLNAMGVSAAQTRETHAASVFVNGFSSSYLGADGVALCSASHPVGPDNTGTTRDNTGTEAFTYTAMKNARVNMRGWKDGQENPMMVMGKLALLPIGLEDKAVEIFEATNKPGTADNDGNAVQGFQYQIWDYLSDTNDWFMLDPIRTKRFLRWYTDVPFEVMIVEEDTTDIVYEFHMRYTYGWTHWSFVYGNAVA